MNDLVSLIIPVYNAEEYLNRCINSILNQSYKNFEAIFVNDGSKDKSLEILNSYSQSDSRIKIINQKNMGLTGARNTALKIISGKYLMFIDSDDIIKKNYIEENIKVMNKYNCDLTIFNFNRILLDNSEKPIKVFDGYEIAEDKNIIEIAKRHILEKQLYEYVWNKMYVVDIIKKNNIHFQLRMFEDMFFNIDYLDKANTVYYLDKHLYQYYIREGSLITQKIDNVLEIKMFNYSKSMWAYKKWNIDDDKVEEIINVRYFPNIYFTLKEIVDNKKINRFIKHQKINEFINQEYNYNNIKYLNSNNSNMKKHYKLACKLMQRNIFALEMYYKVSGLVKKS